MGSSAAHSDVAVDLGRLLNNNHAATALIRRPQRSVTTHGVVVGLWVLSAHVISFKGRGCRPTHGVTYP